MNIEQSPVQETDRAVRHLVEVGQTARESDVYSGKRGWTRHTLHMRMDVTTDPTDPDASQAAIAHNVSGGGMGLWLKRKLQPHDDIYIREYVADGCGPWIPATVVHCTLGMQGYLVGAAFKEPLDRESADESSPAADESEPKKHAAAVAARPRSWRSRQAMIAACGWLCAAVSCIGIPLGAWLSMTRCPDDWAAWVPPTAAVISGLIGLLAGRLLTGPDTRFLGETVGAIRQLANGETVAQVLPGRLGEELATLREALLDLERMLQAREQHERAHREKLEELNSLKSNFLSIVSHDLRTPLTSILLYARMLMDPDTDLDPQDRSRFLNIIADECTRLSRLVDDLLEVQRLEADRVEWQIRPADLAKVIHTSVRVFEAMAQSKSIRLSAVCPDSLPAVAMDSEKIAQVINNLLSNALKYTPAGGTVCVTAESSGREMLVRVRDSGPGIPRDKWDEIFNRFSQLSDTNVSEFGGVGLGLYIVKWIVERHGGAVWVDSEVGKGSEFCFSLATCDRPERKRKADAAELIHRAVVCDAAPEVVATIAQVLRTKGYEVRPAHSAQRLLAHLNEWEPELVVSDLLLPDMDGPELLQKITLHPRRSGFHLLVHSYANSGAPVNVPGVDVFLLRPVSRDDLLQAVDYVRGSRSRKGHIVLVVGAPGVSREPLLRCLREATHSPIVAENVAEAAVSVQRYPVDRVLVFDACLSNVWPEIDLLRFEGSRARITVVSQKVGRLEREWAGKSGVGLMAYMPGHEEHLVEHISSHTQELREVLTT